MGNWTDRRRLSAADEALVADVEQRLIGTGEGAEEIGGTCPNCGDGYPNRLPIDQDQRCWSCWLDNDPSEADHG